MFRSKFTFASAFLATAIAGSAAAQDIKTSQRANLGSTAKAAGVPVGSVAFAQLNTYNDAEPAQASLKINNQNKLRVWTQRADNETPTAEDADIIAFTGDPAALGLTGETGSFSTPVNSREQRHEITFDGTYENPVLFLQVIANGEPASAQPVFVESDGALISIAEGGTFNGARTASDVRIDWAVFEAGSYELADGRIVLIGAKDAGTSSYDMNAGVEIDPFIELSEGNREDFATDALMIAQAQRSNGNAWQSVRVQRETDTGSSCTFNPVTYGFDCEDADFLSKVTLRHTRDAEIEEADDPEATVGPIGYMIVGERSGTYELIAGVGYQDRYEIAEGSSNFDVALPASVYRAMGGDPDSENTNNTYTTSEDGLSIVRISAVALQANNGMYLEETDFQVKADHTIADAIVFVRVLFSDGTSAFYNGGSGMRLGINGALLDYDSGNIARENRFGVIEHDDGMVSLHSYYGHYVSAAADGTMSVSATDVGDTEKFFMVDMGELAMSPTPNLRLQSADMDGDDDEEVVLLAEQEDGTGYLIIDPLAIADTMYKAGYEPDDDYIAMLSATQQAGLVEQLDDVDGIDDIDDIDGAVLKSVLDSMDESDVARSYAAYEFEYVLEGSLYETGTTSDDGMFGATVTVGEYNLMVEKDEFGVGYEMSATLFSVSGTIGGVLTGTVAIGTVYAANNVDSNGFAFGAGVELVSVTVMVGDEDGSYASVSAGVGTGGYVAAAWGQNDQYGFTVDLPIVPVAVSLYVKGDDAIWVANQVADFAIETYDDVATFASNTWNAAGDWAENTGSDLIGGVQNEWADTKVSMNKFGNSVVAFAESEGEQFLSDINDFANDAEAFFTDIGNGFADGFNAGIDAIEEFFSFSWI